VGEFSQIKAITEARLLRFNEWAAK